MKQMKSNLSFLLSRWRNLPKMTRVWRDHKDCQGILMSRVSILKGLEGQGKGENFHRKHWNVFFDRHLANALPCHSESDLFACKTISHHGAPTSWGSSVDPIVPMRPRSANIRSRVLTDMPTL